MWAFAGFAFGLPVKVNFKAPSGAPSSVTLPDPVVRLWRDLLFGGPGAASDLSLRETVTDLATLPVSDRHGLPTFSAFVLAHLVADIRAYLRDELGADLPELFPT